MTATASKLVPSFHLPSPMILFTIQQPTISFQCKSDILTVLRSPTVMPHFLCSKGKVITTAYSTDVFWPSTSLSSFPPTFSHSICSSHNSLLNVCKYPQTGHVWPGLRIFALALSSALRTLPANIYMMKFIISFHFSQMSPSRMRPMSSNHPQLIAPELQNPIQLL